MVAACAKWTLTVPTKCGSEGEDEEVGLAVEVLLVVNVCVDNGLDSGGILLGTEVQMIAFLYFSGQSKAR